MQVVLSEDVANILAEEAFNTFPELLDVVYVRLFHPPSAVFSIRGSWIEGPHLLFDFKVPRHIRNEVLDEWESAHRLDRDGFIKR